MRDRFHGHHATTSTTAVEHYERALHAVLSHRPGALAALDAALAREPDFVAAYALKGFALVLLARPELLPAARVVAGEANRSLRSGIEPHASETLLVAALEDAVAGHMLCAAGRLEAGLADMPGNVLLLKLAHALRFMAGDAPGMLAATTSFLASAPPADAGTGYAMGCHAFALEEASRFAEAEAWATKALEIVPDDAWALHAASHVDEMQGHLARGISRLEASRPMWTGCNNFQFHMAWHLALLHLEDGNAEMALALYDEAIRHERTDDFRDVANASSLLWRLRDRGIAVGDRWDEIAAIARRRAPETTLAFASLHHLLALVAHGDTEAVGTVVGAWRAKARGESDDQARCARTVAADLAEVLAGREASGTDYLDIARRLHLLGGSNAQREVFLIALSERARAVADGQALAGLSALRHEGRRAASMVA